MQRVTTSTVRIREVRPVLAMLLNQRTAQHLAAVVAPALAKPPPRRRRAIRSHVADRG